MATQNALDNKSAPFTVTNGNLAISSGNITLPTTTSSVGQYQINGSSVLNNYGTNNIFVGVGAGNFTLTTGSATGNTVMGASALNKVTTAANCVAIGDGSLFSATTNIGTTSVGYNAGISVLTGNYNTFLGYNAGSAYTSSETSNIIIGPVNGTISESNVIRIGNDGTGASQQSQTFIAGSLTQARGITSTTGNITATSGNVVLTSGNIVLPATTSSVGQITQAGGNILHTFGTNNMFVGPSSGNFTLTGTANSCFGTNTGVALTSGGSNVVFGSGSFNTLTSGSNNTSIGHASGQTLVSGSGNTLLGYAVAASVSGSNNTIIGQSSGSSYTGSESQNILINAGGTTGDNNVMRLGSVSEITSTYLAGVTGVTVTGSAVLCSTSGQFGTVVSSARYKENINDIVQDSGVLDLRPVAFNYKNDNSMAQQYGLIAEEVDKVMPELVVYNSQGEPESVQYHQMYALLLKEIQRLNERVAQLEKSA